MSTSVPCPRCHMPPETFCQTRTGTHRLPHARRLLLAVGRALVDASLYDGHPLDVAETLAELEPDGWSAQRHRRIDDDDEFVAYRSIRRLQGLIMRVLDTIDGRTLDLTELKAQATTLAAGIDRARAAAGFVQMEPVQVSETVPGQVPKAVLPDLPTPEQAHDCLVQREHDDLRGRLEARRAVAAKRRRGAPVAWEVTAYYANGVFRGQRSDGFTVDGRAQLPEAVDDVLRDRTPAEGQVQVTWSVDPVHPTERLPYLGQYPDDETVLATDRLSERDPWANQPGADLDAFADAIASLQHRWRDVDDVPARLAAEAERLNATDPQARQLVCELHGGDAHAVRHERLLCGRTGAMWATMGQIRATRSGPVTVNHGH